MAPQHEPRERQGSHPIAEWQGPRERSHSERIMDDLETDRTAAAAGPLSWPVVKEALYVCGGVLSVVLTGCATYYGVVGEVRDSRKDIEALTARVVLIERSRAEVMPRFEDSLRNNALQDQRLQNLTEANARTAVSVNDLTRIVGLTSDKVGDMRERMAVMEERLGRSGPHDR